MLYYQLFQSQLLDGPIILLTDSIVIYGSHKFSWFFISHDLEQVVFYSEDGTPAVYMSKCPWGRYWTLKYHWRAHQSLHVCAKICYLHKIYMIFSLLIMSYLTWEGNSWINTSRNTQIKIPIKTEISWWLHDLHKFEKTIYIVSFFSL